MFLSWCWHSCVLGEQCRSDEWQESPRWGQDGEQLLCEYIGYDHSLPHACRVLVNHSVVLCRYLSPHHQALPSSGEKLSTPSGELNLRWGHTHTHMHTHCRGASLILFRIVSHFTLSWKIELNIVILIFLTPT